MGAKDIIALQADELTALRAEIERLRRELSEYHANVPAMRDILNCYKSARKWATGTERHRLALQIADELMDRHFSPAD